MSLAEQSITSNLEEYLKIMTELENKLPTLSRDQIQLLIWQVAVASGDLPQRIAEFLLTLVTVCPSLTVS